jgi:hypothetical protein
MCCKEKCQSGLFSASLIGSYLRAFIGLHPHPLASGRVSLVLALEVALSRRQTESAARHSSIDPEYEPRQPALGRSPDPWRTPQARHRCRSNLGRQVYGKTQEGFDKLSYFACQSFYSATLVLREINDL